MNLDGSAVLNLKAERKLLAEERLKIEDRISNLRATAPSAQNVVLDESFDEIFDMAMELKLKSTDKVDDFKERIAIVHDERQWLDNSPETGVWRDIQARLKPTTLSVENPPITAEAVSAYITANKEAAMIASLERDVRVRDVAIKSIRNQILEETTDTFTRNIAKYVLNIAIAARKELENVICLSITDRKETVNNADQTGENNFLIGRHRCKYCYTSFVTV
jgi:hypothetical protein